MVPFHAEQQAIIGMPRIIDPVLLYDDGRDKSTELNQRVPVATVTSQPRRFDREYGTDAAFADRGRQTLEAWPIDADAGASPTGFLHPRAREAGLSGTQA